MDLWRGADPKVTGLKTSAQHTWQEADLGSWARSHQAHDTSQETKKVQAPQHLMASD